jgi:predicted peroxiredoxin
MRHAGYKFISYSLLLLACSVLASYAPASHAQEEQPQIVVHLSHYSDDLHAASMALKIGRILADSGAEVTLFADLEGSRLGDSRAPQSLVWGSGKSINELYDAFIKAGGSIVLCPHCASVAGISEDSLRKGSRIGTEQEIAALFLAADKVIDY